MRSGILGGTRACLCKNGTYNVKCCDGSIWAQGIGKITRTPDVTPTPTPDVTTYKYRLTKCVTEKNKIAHIIGTELTIGSVYYFSFDNSNFDGCYTVTEAHNGSGQLINTVQLYADCTACETAHP